MSKYSFKRNESFYIREGWFEKAINTVFNNAPNSIFHKDEGIQYLGIGSNMVKGLKYWLTAAGIIEGKESQLTEFGELLHEYDQYLDQKFSWFLIHNNLVLNEYECPLFNYVFTKYGKTFNKVDMTSLVCEYIDSKSEKSNKKYVESDLNVFTHTYVNEEVVTNPEDNYNSPLSQLKLMKKEGSNYQKLQPSYNSLSYLVVYNSLLSIYPDKDAFDIEESMNDSNSPVKVFNLDKYTYMQYLDDMRKNGLITINKTAGLNTVYFEKRLTLKEIFQEYFQ